MPPDVLPANKHAVASDASGAACILVAGMHRSGTSAVVRTLHALGAALPGNLLPSNVGNPEGFGESKDVFEAHDAFMRSIGWRWHTPLPIPPSAFETDAAKSCRASLRTLMSRELAAHSLIAIKDPRLCYLMPLWRELLRELGVRGLAVLVVRNPIEVALSLEKRDRITRAHAFASWLAHTLSAEWHSRGLARGFAAYDAFMTRPSDVIARLSQRLDCFDPDAVARERATPSMQWKPSARHHSAPAFDEDVLSGMLARTYRWHLAAADGAEPGLEQADAIWREFVDVLEVYAPLVLGTEPPRRRRWRDRLQDKPTRLERYAQAVGPHFRFDRR